MKTNGSFEHFIKDMSTHKLKLIESKGIQMEAEIKKFSKEFKQMVMEGFCEDESVNVKVNGKHQLLEISIDPTRPELTKDRFTLCNLIAEAINDANYKIDLIKKKEISAIKYRYTGEVIGKLDHTQSN